MKKIQLCLLLLCSSGISVFAQPVINPQPTKLTTGKGFYTMAYPVRFTGNAVSDPDIRNFYSRWIDKYAVHPQSNTNKPGSIIEIQVDPKASPESYKLSVTPGRIRISGQPAGIFYGLQTLLQLIPSDGNKIQSVEIEDAPRFTYRGLHLDVSRHFFNVDEVKQYIDFLALHKLNSFHWHLTDDQGWRIPIDKYPLLTSTGSCRAQTLVGRFGSDTYDNTPYCHSYTKSDIRDVVKYAAQRHINIIPEIDMPGHMLAALASYPFLGCRKGPYEVMQTWGVSPEVLCAGNDSTYAFMQNVLDEVIELFPSKYIHIGGDECPKERWKTCPVCQQRIKTEGLKDEHELQSYFIRRMEKYLLSKGRNIIGWDEILEGGLAPHATVMSWRGIKGGIEAAKQHHDVIMSPESPLYLNHQQSRMEDSVTQGGYNPLEAVYAYEPVPDTLGKAEAPYILGPQGNMWSEYISNMSKLQYMLFPRIAALAEVAWSTPANRNWDRFRQQLPAIMKRYDQLGLRYSTAYYDPQPQVIPLGNNGIGWKMDRNGTIGKLMISTPADTGFNMLYTQPITITAPGTYKARVVLPDGRFGSSVIQQAFHFNLATGKNVTLARPPNVSYKGQGGFTLVDGVQNTAGMLRGVEFLGYLGRDLDATIDLGDVKQINAIVVHCFEQKPSWIYRPAKITYYGSTNGTDYSPLGKVTDVNGTRNLLYELKVGAAYRYIRIVAANFGLIPPDNPGAGGRSWLFCDEIEIN